MEYYENLYYYGKYALYLLYILAYFGLWNKAPIYLNQVDYYLKLLIALLLVLLFNPLHSTGKFTEFHKNIAFSAGFLLLTSMTLTGIKNQFMTTYSMVHDDVQTGIQNIITI